MVSPPWRRQKPLGVEWQQKVQPNHGIDSAQSQSLDSDGEIHTLVCVFNGSATESFESPCRDPPHLSMSRAPAIRASIATDLAPSFRVTLPRCIFTVTSLIDNSFATCLFISPDATSAIT
jgi:hypothetical protein